MSETNTMDPPVAVVGPSRAAADPSSPAAVTQPAPAAPSAPLLSKGAAAAPDPVSPIPAKYQVKAADGSIDVDASVAKWSEGHKNLEHRLGAGDAPPAKPEDYAPTLPAGLDMEALKADPLYAGFLKGAHARGMSNADVSFVLESYQARVAMSSTPEVAEAELRKTWQTDEQLSRGLADAYRATRAAVGKDADRFAKVQAKFQNDPDFLYVMAQFGKEMHEDTSVQGLSATEQQSMEALMGSKAYLDAKDPEHAVTVARVQAMYAKKYPQT